MLIRFQSEANADVVMFEDVAMQLLGLMGRDKKVPSAMYAEDIPQTLDKLRAAINSLPEKKEQLDEADEEVISLATRALPLLELLEKSAREEKHVMWDAA